MFSELYLLMRSRMERKKETTYGHDCDQEDHNKK